MSTDGSESVSRRGFMRAATGTAAAAAGAAGTAAAESEEQETTEGEGGGGGGTREVTVGPGGSLEFDPADLEIQPGTTVHWTWDSDNHNVVPSSKPEESGFQGTEGGDDQTYNAGHEYSHTFEVEGDYEYYCTPHRQAGMTGAISVSADAGGGSSAPAIPSSAKTLGIATTAALVFTLGLAYFFLKYGGDYGDVGQE
jgi:plastocyanin